MRVITGQAKGRSLKSPKGLTTRPTSDKVRGAIFAMLESLLEEERPPELAAEENLWAAVRVLDLYAGTGALGIEALSRGAASADFVEIDPAACRVVRENLALTGLASRAQVYCLAARHFLTRAAGEAKRYHLIVMDPPYAETNIAEILGTLGQGKLLAAGGRLVVEHSRRRELPSSSGSLVRVRLRRHGDTEVSIYVRQRDIMPKETADLAIGP